MRQPVEQARYGDGFMYAVFQPGSGSDEDGEAVPQILCDQRDLDEIYSEAATSDPSVLSFRGVHVEGRRRNKSIVMSVGVGRVHLSEGTTVRYHDGFIGPEEDESSPPQLRNESPQAPPAPPSPFQLR